MVGERGGKVRCGGAGQLSIPCMFLSEWWVVPCDGWQCLCVTWTLSTPPHTWRHDTLHLTGRLVHSKSEISTEELLWQLSYSIKTQLKARNGQEGGFGCLELCLYGIRELAPWSKPIRAKPRWTSTNESGPLCVYRTGQTILITLHWLPGFLNTRFATQGFLSQKENSDKRKNIYEAAGIEYRERRNIKQNRKYFTAFCKGWWISVRKTRKKQRESKFWCLLYPETDLLYCSSRVQNINLNKQT